MSAPRDELGRYKMEPGPPRFDEKDGYEVEPPEEPDSRISLRDYFAIEIMQAMITAYKPDPFDTRKVSEDAYKVADDMLKVRDE